MELLFGTKIKVPQGRKEAHSEGLMEIRRVSSLHTIQEISGPEIRKKTLRVNVESEQSSDGQADVSTGVKVLCGIVNYSSLAQKENL